jgi:hypothetical protein
MLDDKYNDNFMLVDMLLKNGDKLLRFDVTCGS